jgi:hypothetical protein
MLNLQLTAKRHQVDLKELIGGTTLHGSLGHRDFFSHRYKTGRPSHAGVKMDAQDDKYIKQSRFVLRRFVREQAVVVYTPSYA